MAHDSTQVSLLQLPHEGLRTLAGEGQVRHYPKGAILINEGDQADTLFIILRGRVKVYASKEDGREIVLNFHGPGEIVGEMALGGEPRVASVVTIEPTVCAVVSRSALREKIAQDPDFALLLISKLIGRARSATVEVKRLALDDVYERLAELLGSLAVQQGDARVVPEALTQQAIADRIGCSRDMVSRLFKDLVAGGYLSVNKKIITLHKTLPAHW